MAELPLDEAVARFKSNEERIRQFVNAPNGEEVYETEAGDQVPVLPMLLTAVTAQADRATEKATEAEYSATAAYASGHQYSNTTLGLAETVNGQYFLLRTADPQVFDVYLNDAGAPVLQPEPFVVPGKKSISAIDSMTRLWSANGQVLDRFDEVDDMPVSRGDGGLMPSTPVFQKVVGGGLLASAQSSSARYMRGTNHRYSRAAKESFSFSWQITAWNHNLLIGLMIGEGFSDGITVVYSQAGAVVVYSATTTIEILGGNSSLRAFNTGDTVSLRVDLNAKGGGTVVATSPAGVEYPYPVPAGIFPVGRVWLAIRGGGGTALCESMSVERVAESTLAAINDRINIFPDADLQGNSAGSLWVGDTVVEEGVSTAIFPGSNAAVYTWDLRAENALRPGASLTYQFERLSDNAGSTSARNDILFFDAAGVEISRVSNSVISQVGVWESKELTAIVPANAVKITLWAGGGVSATVIKQRNLRLTSNLAEIRLPFGGAGGSAAIISDRRVFVSSEGSNSNPGSESSPLLTLAAAFASSKLAGGGDVILSNGEYYADGISLTTLANAGPISIQSKYGQRARITRHATLGAITKSAGYGKVYQATLAASPGLWVWQHDTPDPRSLIALPERSAYQKGRSHRLPCTRISKAASIAEVDASADTDPRWFWESGVLYFSIYGGGSALSADIRVPGGNALAAGGGSRIEMVGVDAWYSGIIFPLAAAAHLYDVFAFGTKDNAISYDAGGRFTSEYCEAAGSENDGFNSHNTANPNYRNSVGVHLGNWGHDNYGDGHSDHACSLVQFDGGLYEHNGKAGIVPANGSHAIARNTHARNNGLITPNGGGGFAITNAKSAFDPGVGTQFDLYNCVSEFNSYNFMCGPAAVSGGGSGGTTDVNHAMRVFDGRSRGASVAGYFARAGKMTAQNCADNGSVAAKLSEDGGEIIVITSSPLI